ncbi:hypothetical protein AAE478_004089 [Parahypoxylon ruwenzoriense]
MSKTTDRNDPNKALDGENCAVYIFGLPLNCNYQMLLSALRNTGKIFSVLLNPPNRNYACPVAHVDFWNRQGVDRLFEKVRAGRFVIGTSQPGVRLNVASRPAQPPSVKSRALQVQGPSQIINYAFLSVLFASHFYYELEEVRTLYTNGRTTVMRWTFCSYRVQSELACLHIFWQKLRRDFPPDAEAAWESVRIRWIRDPCE